MNDELSAQAAGIGALAEPVRRDLYLFVVGRPDPVGREQAAEGVGVPLHTAKFHLDKLVDEGLLEVEFRRLTGRTGPGAGRPSKLYRRSARELSVSLPQRRYDLAGRILAAAVDRAAREQVPVDAAVREAARDEGRRSAAAAEPVLGEERLTEVLVDHGYEPRLRDGEVLLANCPFDALVHDHTALVCGLNEQFVGGVLEGLGCTEWRACLDPEPGLCCVKLRPGEDPSGGLR
ncbi:MAG: helix-turn-helix transcriptional regulator [Nocardioides sp.]